MSEILLIWQSGLVVIQHGGFILEVVPMQIIGLWKTLQSMVSRVHQACVSKY
ncbi:MULTISPECIES: hypothetical protein [unclassified Pseudomonas]|uniref:hypothetical protein n=1 Tax=unclassified Pseudomonas TaxID=196821 RepID=UPI00130504F4|nr:MULTISPECIES: hypothetical protein [unclassified Pseudomonas]MDX9673807.1 hypothetical protein [Pseudomonas sp. P8_250]WPN37667.1 hypothetical protein QMK53_08470 [Pseudomonas sp. P8_139]WPN40530.1 hypothetical protein QMK55_22905 [Pseudomonas sp. P8_229]